MEKHVQVLITAVFVLLLLATNLRANNITVSNISLTGQNTAYDFTLVQFDLSWDNSWRTISAPNNRDVAWIFTKFRADCGGWQHAWLNDESYSTGTGASATIDVGLFTPGNALNAITNPGLVAFIYHLASGTGTFSATGMKLRSNYGAIKVQVEDMNK